MNITITGRKCSPREDFKQRAEKKLKKIERFFGPDASAKIVATAEKKFKEVEITISNKGMIFRAQEKADDLSEALDKCVDTLIRQIRKNKTKLEKRLKSGSIDDLITPEQDAPDNVVDETDYEVVRTKNIAVKPQSVDEAILQMNLLGHEFYMFRNSATDEISVVYKRSNGGYGLLEPTNE